MTVFKIKYISQDYKNIEGRDGKLWRNPFWPNCNVIFYPKPVSFNTFNP